MGTIYKNIQKKKYKEMGMYNYFQKTYIKRDKILSLEGYFINFWNKSCKIIL